MPSLSPQQIQSLQEWVDSLPWPRRWAVKAGLVAGGYMDWRGRFKAALPAGFGCLILCFLLFLFVLWLIGHFVFNK